MADEQVGGNSATAVAEPVTGQAAPAATPETTSAGGQAIQQAQGAPAQDSFTDIDPETLPPELQAKYKSMLADYTKKTMGVAELRKKADTYDQLARDKRVVEFVNGLSKQQKADFKDQKAVEEKRLGEKITDEEFAKGFQTKDDFLTLMERVVNEATGKSQKEINELKNYKSVNEAQNIVDQFATAQDKEGNPLRPDFAKLEEDQLISGFLSINPPEDHSQGSYTRRLDEAYAWAKNLSQKYYEAGKAEALKIVQAKAATSTNPPTQAVKGAYTGPDPKKLTTREAMDLAKKGIRVPRDD